MKYIHVEEVKNIIETVEDIREEIALCQYDCAISSNLTVFDLCLSKSDFWYFVKDFELTVHGNSVSHNGITFYISTNLDNTDKMTEKTLNYIEDLVKDLNALAEKYELIRKIEINKKSIIIRFKNEDQDWLVNIYRIEAALRQFNDRKHHKYVHDDDDLLTAELTYFYDDYEIQIYIEA